MAERILMKEYQGLAKEPWLHINLIEESVFKWDIALIVVNPDSEYNGGYFKGIMDFPKSYPYEPPKFQFQSPLFHPNIYEDGTVCISILHAPGEDAMSGETAAERWSPAQRVESVLISILSLLDDAEVSSPANVDAGKMLRYDPLQYKERIRLDVAMSRLDIPDGVELPTDIRPHRDDEKIHEDPDFWCDSDDDLEFAGSDTEDEVPSDEDDAEQPTSDVEMEA
ncbi:MAG: hypothetical protein M1825_001038 [Sarcosagium campestre]|nr:MAG: hypothetical protein M1825_001038 [Sarcosagium campestre]